MRDDVMFHSLRNYTSKDFLEKHRYVSFVTEFASQTWEVFSFYRAPTSFYYIQVLFPTHGDFVTLLTDMKSRSIHDTGVDVSSDDRVLTLSTCVGGEDRNERFVLNARLIKE
jgi:sortase B